MEKFALLNLLKVIDGLKKAQNGQNAQEETASAPPPPPAEKPAVKETAAGDMPNLMYETLMRHEQISNRIKNKK